MSIAGPVSGPRALDGVGLRNARDLGGLRTSDGRVVAPRRLFRAELLAHPGSDPMYSRWNREQPLLTALGIRTVLDLRGDGEAAAVPSAWAEATGARGLSFPIEDGGEGDERDYVAMLISGELPRFESRHLAEHYIAVLEDRATTFAAAIGAIASGAPALIHCTEGKDRTGLLVALVLSLLGVPNEVIVDDYAMTGLGSPDRALAYAPRFAGSGVDLDRFRTIYEAPSVAMVVALQHIDERHGGAEPYLVEHGGMRQAVVGALQDALLVDDPPTASR